MEHITETRIIRSGMDINLFLVLMIMTIANGWIYTDIRVLPPQAVHGKTIVYTTRTRFNLEGETNEESEPHLDDC